MVVCKMTLVMRKMKRAKAEQRMKWYKLKKEECCMTFRKELRQAQLLKKEECCMTFRKELRQALGGQEVLPNDWTTTANVIRETGRSVLGVSSGRKVDKETWWWNEEVKECVRRKRLDSKEGETDLYRLARQRDRDGKDVQHSRMIKDRDGSVLTGASSVMGRWKEYFEELMNEENERERRAEEVTVVDQEVAKISEDEVRRALKRMKSGKALGPDDIPVEVWKCLGEMAVHFLTGLFNRILDSEKMLEEWRISVMVPIFKNKGVVATTEE
ncbi:hypothetical protein D5F01_LYC08793 [Larimichthys crocea]|uniref:Reverse transcriptase domain-containing protein n=1 Tax=Larimichthys crocea TaxID=215358 RepID=A0A6G0IQW7_LARCR|nr:hypothetical protein D5F01_LYC23040 [Larimichthys crocea]KAE8293681.1 hypothetical protein D5F01_LYC08793 [Larimichthys crocea]